MQYSSKVNGKNDGDLDAALGTTRAWYGDTVGEFVRTPSNQVIGELLRRSDFSVLQTQRDAWLHQVEFLKGALQSFEGSIFLEFEIPRMGRRIDAVLITERIVFPLEFKVGETEFGQGAIEQVWDYALDLKNFHRASHEASIVPILIVTSAMTVPKIGFCADADGVYRPICIDSGGFRNLLQTALSSIDGPMLDAGIWKKAPYHPTPTIIEAARALYAQHSVEAIARYDAGAINLRTTSKRLDDLVDEALEHRQKSICFVTGVPGAGKTLVGLNVATRHRRDIESTTSAVFLSGNGPLVAVLREALTRDEVRRQKERGAAPRKGKVGESVKAFIQNVHHFRDEGLKDPSAPFEHVVIFDEAQRAWNLRQTANFMRRKKNQADFNQSEPEFLISYMDRHKDWAVIICLVGGGQEINVGEAGIAAWLDAVGSHFPEWHLYISSRLVDSEYTAGHVLEAARERLNVHFDDSLHLSVSMRSFRAENVSTFVKALLDIDRQQAARHLAELKNRYPIVLTRDLTLAKQWVRDRARGSERFGLVASSKAQRLKPHAIDIRVDIDPVHWFLNDRSDTRASYYLEDAATEFQVQGLELDWVCVTWDADLRFNGKTWSFHDFRGCRWCNISNDENRNYLRNAYRVLLTRARQGMVIFVPRGDPADPTRSAEYYDHTFQYLASIGVPTLAEGQ